MKTFSSQFVLTCEALKSGCAVTALRKGNVVSTPSI
jgi:hypothetical protein